MNSFSPFSSQHSSASAGDMNFVSSHGKVEISGDVQLTRDRVGLKAAQSLQAAADKLVSSFPADLASGMLPPPPVVSPFAEDASSVGIGALTVENGTDRMAFYGSTVIGADKSGVAVAMAIKSLADAAAAYLTAVRDLPETVAVTAVIDEVKNPFG